MNEIVACGDVLPTVFIRFNPDTRVDSLGVRDKSTLHERLPMLKREIELWLSPSTEQPSYAIAVYLYYDGEVRRVESVPFEHLNSNGDVH